MGKKNTLIKRRHSTAILRPTKMTDGEETFEQLGAEPKHFASKLFMDLLNKDYRYLFVFIGLSVVGLVVMFWLPFLVLILSYTCPMSNNGTAVCNPPLTEAYTAWDAFAVAFASLFAVPTHYTATSVIAVTLVAIEFAVGKLAVAGLTALLVIKVSRVPNNLVLSSRVLVHKPHDHWRLSMRIGLLHSQTISGANFRLFAVMRQNGHFVNVDLPFDSSKLRAGCITIRQEPISFSHTVTEESPLYAMNFENVHSLKKELLYIMLTVHGFDDITGRSLGIEKRYNYDRWNMTGGSIYVKARGYMGDVVLRLSESQKKITGAENSMAINWPNFNLIHESSKGKAKHRKGSSTLDLFSPTKQTVPSVQLVQMEEGRKNSASTNNNVLGSGGASQYVVPRPSNKGGEQGETNVQGETDGGWKSKDSISLNKRVSTASSNSNPRGSFSSVPVPVQISEAAMKLSPRSLTKKIDELISEIESFQQKDDVMSRLNDISKNGFETKEDIEKKTIKKKKKINKTRVDWTRTHLDLARKKYDHLVHKQNQMHKNHNENVIDDLFGQDKEGSQLLDKVV
jgi:hypothetical protein